MNVTPKRYQAEAKDSVLDIFRYACKQIDETEDQPSRRAASAYNGCVLIQAPTGAGKTLIAGMVAQEFSKETKIVWLWFTPFAGLVEQARISIKNDFQGLRVRDISCERVARGTRSGDVFVTTWASVATSRKNAKRIRRDGDESVSLDHFLEQLRDSGFKVGVLVDEAHHTFSTGTESVKFYREVLKPDFTLMITATPDDQDAENFRKSSGIAVLHRVTVSRLDAVEAKLIKGGIKSVAYLAGEQHRDLVDFGLAALMDGVRVHLAIKAQLAAEGIDMVPLLLVQVDSSEKSVAKAKKDLMSFGIREEAIAVYTSKEPDDELLAVARDESREVLIFKMAVALGFDAPRAFTLVSMRGAQDRDFGVQIVGRILRVDRRLQGRQVSELLKYGYVFLADAEKQTGLTGAADKINAIQTEMSAISPFTMLVTIGGQTNVQVVENGRQPSLLATPWDPPALPDFKTAEGFLFHSPTGQRSLFDDFILPLPPADKQGRCAPDSVPSPSLPQSPGQQCYGLRDGIPRVFKTERRNLDTSGLLHCVEKLIKLDDNVLTAGLRRAVSIKRKEEEIFTHDVTYSDLQAGLSDTNIAIRGQRLMFEPDYLDPRELQKALLNRLTNECREKGFNELLESPENLRRAMHLILIAHKNLLREALRTCSAQHKELVDTVPLPETVTWPTGCTTARLGVYGVFPSDLNNHELAFAQLLDGDMSETVEWWHRNEPSKLHSVGLVMPDGKGYFPDFMVKVKGRSKGGGILMIEVKGEFLMNSGNTPDKAQASHGLYRHPLMVMLENSGRWMTLRFNERTDKLVPDAVFRLDALAEY
jgi:superfamily II DNA or RNA helicase